MFTVDFLELCRLCLVKEGVSVPIFEGEGDAHHLFQKIDACLPVKVEKDDELPKKICDSCLLKVESVYQFWNITANAEKQLLQWLSEIKTDDRIPSNNATIETEQLMLKEEAVENEQSSEVSKTVDKTEVVLEDVEDEKKSEEEEDEETESDDGSNSEESGDDVGDGPGKEEAESEDEPDGELEPTTFVNVSLCDEAGPSGLQQQQTQQVQAQTAPAEASSTNKVVAAPAAPAASGMLKLRTFEDELKPVRSLSFFSAAPIHMVSPVNTGHLLAQNLTAGNGILNSKFIPTTVVSSPRSENCNNGNQFLYHRSASRYSGTTSCTSSVPFLSLAMGPKRNQINQLLAHQIISENEVTSFHTLPVSNNESYEVIPKLEIQSDWLSSKTVIPPSCSPVSPSNVAKKTDNIRTGFNNMQPQKGNLVLDALPPLKDTVKVFKCCTCGKTSSSKRNLRAHLKCHSDDKPFKCDICSKSFKRSSTLSCHKKLHAGIKNFSCDFCNYTSVFKTGLVVHRRRHLKEYIFNCDICNKGFHSKIEWDGHQNRHSGKRPYSCDLCGKSYALKNHLNGHIRSHQKKNFQCKVCNKEFVMKNKLLRHMRSHTGEYPYLCEVCGKSVSTIGSLQIHRRIHTGEKPNKCDVCDKTFSRLTYLRVHMRTHSGERPHRCDSCGKTFTQRSSLTIHHRYHTGERPYVCQICGKGFVSKTQMKAHQVNHNVVTAVSK